MTKKAEDGFERYFTEKIWEMIPAIYRHEDGLADNPGVLRALVELIAGHAAILRRSHDRLWEDQFIERCCDWVVPYIADLLGTRLVSAKNLRGRRVDVAKTIYYRRRKGTPRVLEELISDISGWEGKLVENFLRLARTRHGLDPLPGPLAGIFSGTMPGGWADLRKQRASELAGGPFCEFYHTPDMRRHRGVDGRYAIPKLAFHLFRLMVFEVRNATPFSRNSGGYTFDPSGRSVPLFMKRNRPDDWEEWYSAREWELPAPMCCRVLGHAEYEINEKTVRILEIDYGISLLAAGELRTLIGHRFHSENQLIQMLETLINAFADLDPTDLTNLDAYEKLLEQTIVKDCGKNALLPGSVSVEAGEKFVKEKITAANLDNWDADVLPKRLAIHPERGRLMFVEALGDEKVTYHYGFSAEIGAGTYERYCWESDTMSNISGGGVLDAPYILANDVTQINDSATYSHIGSKDTIENMILQAANGERPYIRLDGNWSLNTKINTSSQLILDGLWIGSDGPHKISLQGYYEKVLIRHCTLDPGGGDDANDEPIHPVSLVIDGTVEQLEIEASIIGPIEIGGNGMLEKLVIRDSILQSIGTNPVVCIRVSASLPTFIFKITKESLKNMKSARIPVKVLKKLETLTGRVFIKERIFLDKIKKTIGDSQLTRHRKKILKYTTLNYSPTEVELNRVTVLGAMKVHRLWASDTLVTGDVQVTDTQNGCFRFSAAPKGSRLPKAYESYIINDSNHYFTSRSFGQPGYGQLSETAPVEIERGGENGAEMGAFNMLLNPIKMDSLEAKVNEYMPFSRIPIYIKET